MAADVQPRRTGPPTDDAHVVRIALAVAGSTCPEWVCALASALTAIPEVDLTVVAAGPNAAARPSVRPAARLWSFYRYVDAILQRLVCRGSAHPSASADLRRAGLRVVREVPADLDVVVNAAGPWATAMLREAAGAPVWWLDHDGHACWPNVCSGYAETLTGDPVTVCRLLESRPEAPAPSVLRSAFFATHPLFGAENRVQLLWKSIALVAQKARELRRSGVVCCEVSDTPARAAPAPLATAGVVWSACVVARHVWRSLLFVTRRLFWREQWCLMIGDHPAAAVGAGRGEAGGRAWAIRPRHVIVPGADRYWADPHVVPGGDDRLILVEEYMYATRRGRIALLRLGEAGEVAEARTVLEKDCHLSYPAVFEVGEDLYMVPESSELGRVEAFRCADFPWRWEAAGTLIDGVRAIDSSIVEHGGRWWLFATVMDEPWLTPRDTLDVYYADDPVKGPWVAHLGNPVMCDARLARPAGRPFVLDGRLYRPSQDCSRRYGYGIRINEVVTLSTTAYREREVSFIEPVWDQFAAAHSYALGEHSVVIDAMRWLRGRKG